MSKLDQDASACLQLNKVKDQSMVRLSNQLNELELSAKIDQASPPVNGNGTQWDSDKEKETLQDTVTAFLMQNKFLNKEVQELNQLRQQAIDREQKLFIEASDWEAKFYQIQSKYLLLPNELHNPQVRKPISRIPTNPDHIHPGYGLSKQTGNGWTPPQRYCGIIRKAIIELSES